MKKNQNNAPGGAKPEEKILLHQQSREEIIEKIDDAVNLGRYHRFIDGIGKEVLDCLESLSTENTTSKKTINCKLFRDTIEIIVDITINSSNEKGWYHE